MKLLFIYVVLVLVVTIYIWVNAPFKEFKGFYELNPYKNIEKFVNYKKWVFTDSVFTNGPEWYKVVTNGYSIKMANTGITLPTKKYSITFMYKLTGLNSGYNSIFHITNTGKDCCGYGDRIPALWISPNQTKFYLTISADSNGNNGLEFDAVPLNTPVLISFLFDNNTISMYINNVKKYTKSYTNIDTIKSGATLYIGDPWYKNKGEVNIQDFTIYDDILTSDQITRIYNESTPEAKAKVLEDAKAKIIADAKAAEDARILAEAKAVLEAKAAAEAKALAEAKAIIEAKAVADAKAAAKAAADEKAAADAKAAAKAVEEANILEIKSAAARATAKANLNGIFTEKDSNTLKTDKVSPGINSIDRYADPMCKPNEFIYCVDGQIECNDILGGKMNSLQGMDSYTYGNTLARCGSHINKTNISDYGKSIELKLGTGVYFDISNCTKEKPWRVGNRFVKSQGCYKTEAEADTVWNTYIDSSLNLNARYNINDNVYILASFLKTQTLAGLPQILSVLDSGKSYTTINGQKYYNGIVYSITGTTYTITLSTIKVSNVPKVALLKDSLYNPITNDYYNDLKTGSYPRPVCKSGSFTSCLSSPPFTMNNGKYVSTSDPILNVDSSSKTSQIQRQNDFNQPFSAPLVNPSGIYDGPIESNYFSDNQTSTPFIKCIANYGSNIGDPLCCNQKGALPDTRYVCPQEVPRCSGYSANDNTYGYCS